MKDGTTYRMVPDHLGANHCGFSRVTLNGVVYSRTSRYSPNQISLGIELENWNNGTDPYTEEQLQAMGWVLRDWRAKYGAVPILFHRDIDTGGKTDARGLDYATVERYMALPTAPVILPAPANTHGVSAHSPILARPRATANEIATYIKKQGSVYDAPSIDLIVAQYIKYGTQSGVDPLVAVAQSIYETRDAKGRPWSSWWASRPQRNPAGMGVSGERKSGQRPPGADWALRSPGVWLRGLSFKTWDLAVQAHIGHLLMYTIGDAASDEQQVFIDADPRARYVPELVRGKCTRLVDLNGKWVVPGANYGQAVAVIANAILGEG